MLLGAWTGHLIHIFLTRPLLLITGPTCLFMNSESVPSNLVQSSPSLLKIDFQSKQKISESNHSDSSKDCILSAFLAEGTGHMPSCTSEWSWLWPPSGFSSMLFHQPIGAGRGHWGEGRHLRPLRPNRATYPSLRASSSGEPSHPVPI